MRRTPRCHENHSTMRTIRPFYDQSAAEPTNPTDQIGDHIHGTPAPAPARQEAYNSPAPEGAYFLFPYSIYKSQFHCLTNSEFPIQVCIYYVLYYSWQDIDSGREVEISVYVSYVYYSIGVQIGTQYFLMASSFVFQSSRRMERCTKALCAVTEGKYVTNNQ